MDVTIVKNEIMVSKRKLLDSFMIEDRDIYIIHVIISLNINQSFDVF